MDKLKMWTANKADENFKKLAEMFPNAVTETIDENGKLVRAIDKDILTQEISCFVVDGKRPRYEFMWPDKYNAILTANAPTRATLRPVRDDETVPTGKDSKGNPYCSSGSVDFDNTENLYIEGDNLEVLKVLRNSYKGKIKMIYIDPPYNTGNDFVYEDDFVQSMDEYLENSGQVDEEGNRLKANNESNGRFHTDWLNMIYPRLKLARDLLTDDGVIFISIDDNEQENLKKCCNEIFGADNFIAEAIVQKSTNGMGDKKGFAKNHEFILCYQKSSATSFYGLSPDDDYISKFNLSDKYGKYKMDGILMKKGAGSRREDSPTLYFPLYYSEETGKVYIENKDGLVERYPIKSDGTCGRWTWGRDKIKTENHRLYASPNGTIYIKDYLTNDRRMKMKTILNNKNYLTDKATNEIKAVFNSKPFDTPKPIDLLKHLIDNSTQKNDIILDFFSGSATSAHAVMQLNAEDGGNRKFIMVQLPEVTDEKSEAYKAGYKNICEIGKERIRRAGKKILEEATKETAEFAEYGESYEVNSLIHKYGKLDVGFRVLKLDETNMKDVYYKPNDYIPSMLEDLTDNIKEDRTPEDLLFQVMLSLGLDLSSKIIVENICGKKVFDVKVGDRDYVYACFDKGITEEVVNAIASKKPDYAVFRDSGMNSDSTFENFEQIFKMVSPDTERIVL